MTDSEKLDLLLERVGSLDTKVDSLDTKVDSLEEDVHAVKSDVQTVKLIMENELRVNIQRVAEGHFDLSRNLHEAMKPSNEVEMLSIKVRMLESDMRELKAKIS